MHTTCVVDAYSPIFSSEISALAAGQAGYIKRVPISVQNPTYSAMDTLVVNRSAVNEIAELQRAVRDLHFATQYVKAADILVDFVMSLLEADDYATLDELLAETTAQVLRREPELENADGVARIVTMLSLTRRFAHKLSNFDALNRSIDVKAALRVV